MKGILHINMNELETIDTKTSLLKWYDEYSNTYKELLDKQSSIDETVRYFRNDDGEIYVHPDKVEYMYTKDNHVYKASIVPGKSILYTNTHGVRIHAMIKESCIDKILPAIKAMFNIKNKEDIAYWYGRYTDVYEYLNDTSISGIKKTEYDETSELGVCSISYTNHQSFISYHCNRGSIDWDLALYKDGSVKYVKTYTISL